MLRAAMRHHSFRPALLLLTSVTVFLGCDALRTRRAATGGGEGDVSRFKVQLDWGQGEAPSYDSLTLLYRRAIADRDLNEASPTPKKSQVLEQNATLAYRRAPIGADGSVEVPLAPGTTVDLAVTALQGDEPLAVSGLNTSCPARLGEPLPQADATLPLKICVRLSRLPIHTDEETSPLFPGDGWRIVPTNATTEAYQSWDWPQADGVDLSNGFLKFSLKVDHLENAKAVAISFGNDRHLTASMQYNLNSSNQGQPYLESGVWLPITLIPARAMKLGADGFDLMRTHLMRVRLIPQAMPLPKLSISAIQWHPSQPNGKVAIVTFDDGLASVYATALPLMRDRQIPGVAYVITDYLGRETRLSTPHLELMQRQGWDIAAHSDGILTALSEAEVRSSLRTTRDFLFEHGYFSGAFHYAYPHGEYKDAVTPYVRPTTMSIFDTARGIFEGHAETAPPGDLSRLRVVYVERTNTPESVIATLRANFDVSAPSILVFHNIVEADATKSTDYLATDFAKILDAGLDMGLTFTTMSEWLKPGNWP